MAILCRIVGLPYILLKDYIDELKEHGGYRGYRMWKREEKINEKEREREWQIKKVEYERITSAYKRSELQRNELPRVFSVVLPEPTAFFSVVFSEPEPFFSEPMALFSVVITVVFSVAGLLPHPA